MTIEQRLVSVESQTEYSVTSGATETRIFVKMYVDAAKAGLIKLAQEGRGPGTFLVLNEPHQFMSRGLVHFAKRMLREGPKYKCAPIIVFHDFSAFHEYPGFTDTLLSASINWHLFRNTHIDTYKRLMPYLSRTFTDPQAAFEATRQYQFIACWLNRGEYEAPFVADALPLVGKRYDTQNNARLTQEHTRKYGRPITEVLAEIRRKNRGPLRS